MELVRNAKETNLNQKQSKGKQSDVSGYGSYEMWTMSCSNGFLFFKWCKREQKTFQRLGQSYRNLHQPNIRACFSTST